MENPNSECRTHGESYYHEGYCPAVRAYDPCVDSLSIPTQAQLDQAEMELAREQLAFRQSPHFNASISFE